METHPPTTDPLISTYTSWDSSKELRIDANKLKLIELHIVDDNLPLQYAPCFRRLFNFGSFCFSRSRSLFHGSSKEYSLAPVH